MSIKLSLYILRLLVQPIYPVLYDSVIVTSFVDLSKRSFTFAHQHHLVQELHLLLSLA